MEIETEKVNKRKAESVKSPRGEGVNSLSEEKLEEIINFLKKSKLSSGEFKVTKTERPEGYWRCNLACTKDAKGNPKYPQVDLKALGIEKKQLIHLIWWRWENNGALIDPDLHISHCDADHKVLHLVQESRDLNESRKYCHLFGWYKTKPGEERPRCPHWEHPCTGP